MTAWLRAACVSLALASVACGEPKCEDPGDICTAIGIPNVAQASPDGLEVRESALYLPLDLTVAPDGRLYLVDFNNHRLRRVESDGTVNTIMGTAFLGDGPEGSALDFALNHPTDLAFHPDDPNLLYIAAWHNSRVNVLDLRTGEARYECGTGARAFAGDGGPAEESALDLPSGVAFDDEGNLYISDQANQIIRLVSPDGIIETVAGQQRDEGFSGDGGPASEAQLHAAVGQAAAPSSGIALRGRDLLIADSGNHVVRHIDLDSWIIETVAGVGQERGHGGDGGPATQAQLFNPVDVEIASDGTFYIADRDNHCVRQVAPDGTLRTVAGVCGSPGFSGDGGRATEALLHTPGGIALDGDDILYVADTYNHVFRKVLLD